MVLRSDCETGNKNAFEILNEKLKKGAIDPELEFLCIFPDCPHVGKSMKAAFSNWWLKCKDERINLGLNECKYMKHIFELQMKDQIEEVTARIFPSI